MARLKYLPQEIGKEIVAPSGFYQPIEERVIEYNGKKLLYVLGSACIDSSCCGIDGWQYLRVEGYVANEGIPAGSNQGIALDIDTIGTEIEKEAISKFLANQYKNVRINFR